MNDICDLVMSEMVTNPFIPVQFIEYTKCILANQDSGIYIEALLKTPSAVIRDIGYLFREAANIVGLSPEELLAKSSFRK